MCIVHEHAYVAKFLGQGRSRLNLGSSHSLGLRGTGVLVSGALDVSGLWVYGGAVGPRSPLDAALSARTLSASRPSPARALAAASIAARAGGAPRCPLLAVAVAIAICPLIVVSGAEG